MADSDLNKLIAAGIDAHVRGELDAAMWCYGAALELDPRNTLVYYNVACLFEEAGYPTEAANCFRAAQAVCETDGVKDVDILRAVQDYGVNGVN